MKISTVVGSCLCLLLAFGCTTYHRVKSNRLLGEATLVSSDFYQLVPYETVQDMPVFTVEIEGKPYRFIFDTGGYNVFSSALLEELKENKQVSYIDVKDSNNTTKRIFTYRQPELKIGEVVFQDVGLAKIGFTEADWFRCLGIDGTLGPGILKECAWLFDNDQQQLILSDDINKLRREQGIRVAVHTDNVYKPWINYTLAGEENSLTFDTGANGDIRLKAPADSTYLTGFASIEKMGHITNAGNSKVQHTLKLYKLDSLQIDALVLPDPVITIAEEGASSIMGSRIFRTHNVLLNLANDELVFYERAGIKETSSLRTIGFGFDYQDGKIVLAYVYRPSPAYTAGLRVGQEISQIDGNTYTFTDYCDFFQNFELPEKDTIRIGIIRNGVEQELILTKEVLF